MKEGLKNLGFDEYFESKITDSKDGYFPARVISEYKEAYTVKDEKGEYFSKITGKSIFNAKDRGDYPAVGDWVFISKPDNEHAIIHSILPRKSIIRRRFGDKNKKGEKNDVQIIATNIDVAFIVESVDRDYNLNRFERYFAILNDGDIQPVIIINKVDLLSQEQKDEKINELKTRFPSINIIMTSAMDEHNIDKLRNYIKPGKTYCFLGSSGVGKSSLINKLIGDEIITTSGISKTTGRGKHTTTSRQMYFLKDGGIVIDNPGIREVGIVSDENSKIFFNEIISEKKCKYSDCTHTHEPGCAVIEAIKSGNLDEEKYSNYMNIKKQSEYDEMDDYEKKQKEKDFGKFINKAKKDFKRAGYDNFQ